MICLNVQKRNQKLKKVVIYDYEIKTSQNLADAYCQDADVVNNYELSEDGICPIYCKHCNENKKCLKCQDDYVLVGKLDEEKVECLDKNLVNTGYYKSDENTIICIFMSIKISKLFQNNPYAHSSLNKRKYLSIN